MLKRTPFYHKILVGDDNIMAQVAPLGNFVMYPTGEFRIWFPFFGMTLACIFTLTRNVSIVFKGYFAENLYIFFFMTEPKVPWALKIWLFHIDIIMYHWNFLQVDLSTHESPLRLQISKVPPLSKADVLSIMMFFDKVHVIYDHCQVNWFMFCYEPLIQMIAVQNLWYNSEQVYEPANAWVCNQWITTFSKLFYYPPFNILHLSCCIS